MTELELYKFVNDNDIEYHYYKDYINSFMSPKERIIMFVNIRDIEAFNKLLGKNIMEDEGIECNMKSGYFCFEMMEICEYFAIVPKNVFVNKDKYELEN